MFVIASIESQLSKELCVVSSMNILSLFTHRLHIVIRETVIIMNVVGARGGISRWLPGGIWFIVATPSSNEVPSLTF